jgi:hypothetical protein
MLRNFKRICKGVRTRSARRILPAVERWAQRPLTPATELIGKFESVAAAESPEPVLTSGSAITPDASMIADEVLDGYADVFEKLDDRLPSHMHGLHENIRRMALLRRLGVKHPWWALNPKYASYRFVAQHGISHPEVFGRFSSIDDVEEEKLGSRFLVKPHNGSTNRGIFGLDLQASGQYLDRLSGRLLSWQEVADEYRLLARRNKVTSGLIIEELLEKPDGSGAIPDDWKVYCFYDKAALVMQRDLRQSSNAADWRFKFWSRGWVDLRAIKFEDRIDAELPSPVHGEAIIEQAERLGSLLRLPFVRLDFYDTDRGAVFGEVTLNPGGPEMFGAGYDQYLGRHREFAAARLLAEDVEAGIWNHLLPPTAKLPSTPSL